MKVFFGALSFFSFIYYTYNIDVDMKKNILATVKYFDLFDFPLKKRELWFWLPKIDKENFSKSEFESSLSWLVGENKIQEKNNYYFLPERGNLIDSRAKKYIESERKIKKARKISSLLCLVPGVRAIFVVSNLGYMNSSENSDIDFFVVTKKDMIWTVRFWSVIMMKFSGQRPSENKMKDKICLSYFVAEDNLNLFFTRMREGDWHLAYLISQCLPIYTEKNKTAEEYDYWGTYINENSWIKNYLPNFKFIDARKYIMHKNCLWLKKITESLFWGEKIYKKIQMSILPDHLKEALRRGDNSVIMQNNILKLHSNDKRSYYNKKFDEFINE